MADSLSKANIVYTYHQHSSSVTDQTIDSTSATYDGVSAPTYQETSSGCYTKPYYYYSKVVHHAGTPAHYENCGRFALDGNYEVIDEGPYYRRYHWYCERCGYHVSADNDPGAYNNVYHQRYVAGTSDWDETVKGEGFSIPSGYTAYKTVYYPGCGHAHGECLAATIKFD